MSNGVSKLSHEAPRDSCGVGYVVLSRAQARDAYIGACFRNNYIAIKTAQNEIIPKCIVEKNVWQYLEFPNTSEQRGSAVVWVNVPHQNKVIVIGVLHKRDELNPIQSVGEFKFQRKVGENVVTVHGNGNNGILNIISQGTLSDEGSMYVKILNQNELAVFDLYVQGVANLTTESDMNLKVGGELNVLVRDDLNPENQATLNYTLGTGLTFTDEYFNTLTSNNGGFVLNVTSGNKVYVKANDDLPTQPGLLGNNVNLLLDEVKNLLQSMINALQASSASGATMSASPVSAQIVGWQNSIKDIQGKLSGGYIISKHFENS